MPDPGSVMGERGYRHARGCASTAPTHDEQGHIVYWRTRLAKPGNILYDAVSHSACTVLKVIPQGMNQAFFLVFIANRILRLRDAVGI
jgi:hypothetical protein